MELIYCGNFEIEWLVKEEWPNLPSLEFSINK